MGVWEFPDGGHEAPRPAWKGNAGDRGGPPETCRPRPSWPNVHIGRSRRRSGRPAPDQARRPYPLCSAPHCGYLNTSWRADSGGLGFGTVFHTACGKCRQRRFPSERLRHFRCACLSVQLFLHPHQRFITELAPAAVTGAAWKETGCGGGGLMISLRGRTVVRGRGRRPPPAQKSRAGTEDQKSCGKPVCRCCHPFHWRDRSGNSPAVPRLFGSGTGGVPERRKTAAGGGPPALERSAARQMPLQKGFVRRCRRLRQRWYRCGWDRSSTSPPHPSGTAQGSQG